ncbi:SacI homology domain-containing protein [Dichotomocladium elegans]|nr:SacI homology domain-containing protein [Dichotomocladium elegans]
MKLIDPEPSMIPKENHMLWLHILDDAFVLVNANGHTLHIDFQGGIITSKGPTDLPKDVRSYQIFGILGFIEGFREKYLVVITQAQTLGRIFNHAVYVIEQVACLNLDPRKAREILDENIQTFNRSSDSEEEEEEEEELKKAMPVKPPKQIVPAASFSTPTTNSTRARKHPPAPLANRFRLSLTRSKRPTVESSPTLKMSTSLTTLISSSPAPSLDLFASLALQEEITLDRKIVRQVTELFSRSTFIYAPDYDISNSFQRAYEDPDTNNKRIPLWQKTDRRFWWNEHMCRDFKANNIDEWIIPVIQGTMQIETCEIEGNQFEFILVSRRSRERAGMRYQRRGVNERGESANFVETEQIVIFNRDGEPHIASFVQTRGSIPLFWSQSPYSLHPVPTLDRTVKENNLAFERHFAQQAKLYKHQFAINLTELTGREAIVGAAFRRHVEQLADPNITYIEFDFHRETKGMRFENISKLTTSLRSDLDRLAYFWQAGKNTIYCKQNGVFRTNCMDCLDRTNVVQSAFGREVLNLQLMRFGIAEFHDEGIRYYNDFERIFNHGTWSDWREICVSISHAQLQYSIEVWANNGDMISRMYTGTSALKGDFTRYMQKRKIWVGRADHGQCFSTGKRNITGMMNDASNSLARMYLNTVKDFWQQATIDYVLGWYIYRWRPGMFLPLG